jgi:hypothetical protein
VDGAARHVTWIERGLRAPTCATKTGAGIWRPPVAKRVGVGEPHPRTAGETNLPPVDFDLFWKD